MSNQIRTVLTLSILILPTSAFAAGGGSYGDTKSDYGSATSAIATTGNAQLDQAVQANKDGDHQRSVALLTEFVETNPSNADGWNELGFAQRNLKNYPASAAAYDQALTIDPNHLGALNYQGFMFIETDQVDRARANASKLQGLCGSCEEYTSLAAALPKT